ncbi:hypothetical protein SAMN04488072_12137 [Lentibacillus halodurans]|uniref:Uncharacterized protein n=1 Tax=Lentibacillus halodurans TaxID=237679 RepID=A0A1I1AIR7_9BACI|nr:hypothetical protein SAMN04488072_12137 [Lentibacillus halodurans]
MATWGVNNGESIHQPYIEIRGTQENNLKSITVQIPKGKITIFVAVSGSGRSSIVNGEYQYYVLVAGT